MVKKVSQLHAVGKLAVGEERIFDDVVETDVVITLALKEGMLHGDRVVELALGVIDDNQPLVVG